MLWVLGVWALTAPPLAAQLLPIPPAPRDYFEGANPFIPRAPIHAVIEPPEGYSADAFPFWARCEYTLGRVREAPLPIPLVTTGSTKDKSPGAIGQPSTVVLLGNAGVGYKVISGMRFEFGGWLDSQNILGLEASGFVQEMRVNHFSAVSDKTGTPLIALPFVNQTPGAGVESGQLISNPTKLAGSVVVAATMQRWGTQVNGVFCFCRQPGLEFTLLSGMRYDDLRENLRLSTTSLNLVTNTNTTLDDHFNTRNQFFGAQIGASMHTQRNVLSLDVTTKIALGDTHQVVEIQGASGQSGAKASPAGSFPGGFFAQPSNLGRTAANPFVAIPSIEFKLGYQITPRLRAFLGYDFLYWNEVVRPGNQIDRNVNLTQSPILGTTKGVLSGSAVPAPLFNRSGVWAQDVNFGLELRF
jgi:hypothetical protein